MAGFRVIHIMEERYIDIKKIAIFSIRGGGALINKTERSALIKGYLKRKSRQSNNIEKRLELGSQRVLYKLLW